MDRAYCTLTMLLLATLCKGKPIDLEQRGLQQQNEPVNTTARDDNDTKEMMRGMNNSFLNKNLTELKTSFKSTQQSTNSQESVRFLTDPTAAAGEKNTTKGFVSQSTTMPPPATTEQSTTMDPMQTTLTTAPLQGCIYNGKIYPLDSEISSGREGNWCYWTMCDSYGYIMNADDWNCGSTTPPTTTNPSTELPTAPHTTDALTTTPDLPTNTESVEMSQEPSTPSTSVFSEPPTLGCEQDGKVYSPGSEMSRGKGENWCYLITCSSEGQINRADNLNCEQTLEGPTTTASLTSTDITTTDMTTVVTTSTESEITPEPEPEEGTDEQTGLTKVDSQVTMYMVNFSDVVITSPFPGQLKIRWNNGRPSAFGQINESGNVHHGTMTFPDDRLYLFWFYPEEMAIYWDKPRHIQNKPSYLHRNVWKGFLAEYEGTTKPGSYYTYEPKHKSTEKMKSNDLAAKPIQIKDHDDELVTTCTEGDDGRVTCRVTSERSVDGSLSSPGMTTQMTEQTTAKKTDGSTDQLISTTELHDNEQNWQTTTPVPDTTITQQIASTTEMKSSTGMTLTDATLTEFTIGTSAAYTQGSAVEEEVGCYKDGILYKLGSTLSAGVDEERNICYGAYCTEAGEWTDVVEEKCKPGWKGIMDGDKQLSEFFYD